MENFDLINNGLLVLVPVLYLIGCGLKKSKFISDKNIPLFIGGIGICLSICYYQFNFDGENLFNAVVQGILCAGASNYVNQIYKQGKKK